VRVPIELYKEIETIAVEEYNAPTYKKTGRPQVSQTIIELIRLGLENLRNGISDSSSDKISDSLQKRIEDLESKINSDISDISSDNVSDTVKTLVNEQVESALAEKLNSKLKPLITEIQQIKKNSPLLRTSLV
jgi:uncharacterized protein YwgA